MKLSLLKSMFLGITLSILNIACRPSMGVVEKTHDADDIKIFYVAYGKAIAHANYKQMAEFYNGRGAVLISQGRMINLSKDSIKALYLKKPMQESDYRFDHIQVELLGDSSAVVSAVIRQHQKERTDTAKILYTAVLLKSSSGWKIRQEHESLDFKSLKKLFHK